MGITLGIAGAAAGASAGGAAAAGAAAAGAAAGITAGQIAAGVAVAGAVAGGVGAIMSARAQRQAASQAKAMADLNFKFQQQQMHMQAALAQQQAMQQAKMFEYQAAMQKANAMALLAQATAVQSQYGLAAEAEKKAGVLNVQAEREAARRFLAVSRAKMGESGTTGAGTELDALADAAGILELKAQEVWQGAEIESRKLHDVGNAQAYELREQARNENLTAGMTLFQAAHARWEGKTAETKLRLGMIGAELERMEGYNTAKGYKMASYGTLFSGLASFGSAASGVYSSFGKSTTGSTYGASSAGKSIYQA